MDRYEISLWEDYPDTTENNIPFLNERKLCVIGSNTMTSQACAFEPKMVTNINGTHTFTFKMYYQYIDALTGENIINPFGSLLINERKVKVLWNDQWYDLLIKSLDEDTTTRTITYTCKDLFITELSKNGYDLEFTADLQNNTGTASELAAMVLDGSGWQFDNEGSTKIIQKTEEPVYEVEVLNNFQAIKQSPLGDSTKSIPVGANILVFYSSVIGINTTEVHKVDIQFLYSVEDYTTDINDMLVTNGDCYTVSVNAFQSGGNVNILINDNIIMIIAVDSGVSMQYRAERLVKSQITKYDKLFGRYVNVYKDKQNNNQEVWGYSRTEFTDPLTVLNFIANPNSFTSLDGWIDNNLTYGVYPKFTAESDLDNYIGISYLYISQNRWVYNSGLSANAAFLKPSNGDIKDGNIGGFHVGDNYILRIKFKIGDDPSQSDYSLTDNFNVGIYNYNDNYKPIGNNYFSVSERITNEDWNEYTLTCVKSCPATQIEELGIFIKANLACWIEDIQFFREAYGVIDYNSTVEQRMNPGEVSLQGISKIIYRFYNPDHDNVTSAEEVKFLYEGESQYSSRFVAVTNNYEKITSIEAKNSNRFNILQSIAENFECWIRFIINHDETGRILYDNEGLPQKYVQLVEYVGKDLGWSFEYGIDLKTIKRKIISDDIVTKIIVIPNDNEFGKNGFCTIARSNLNYTKENFILNLDYFISQGLLDQRTLNRDLYSTSNNYIGYYYKLHKWNSEYDELTQILTKKQLEYTKQSSQLVVVENQQKALKESIYNCKSDVMTLACVTNWDDAKAYTRSHADNTKVQSLMNTISQLWSNYNKNKTLLTQLRSSVNKLKTYITTKLQRQKTIITATENLHIRFFKKYARYLQEGTWQDSNYIDDDKYYLDGVDVAYTSSRPQIQYTIDVMRLCSLDDFSSKTFNVGDICYIQDREYFGYGADGITPYKLKIIISEITSYFDQPEKDQIKVQNYKTQFDDLFQRITATTQSLQYSQGGYERAANAVTHDKILSFDLLQDTFDYNEDWVLNASNQHVTWDSTGVTVTDDQNAALQLRLMAGGLFITNDGGATWKNAIRGDGISTDVLTAGRINTSEIFVYDGGHPSFRWDSAGINAYFTDETDIANFGKYVRFDRFGLYGYQGTNDFVPSTEDAIWDSESGVKFGLTWRGFFLRGENNGSSLEISDDGDGIVFKMLNSIGNNSLEISTLEDIVLKTGNIKRIQIGRLNPENQDTEYGIWIRDDSGDNIFNVSSSGVNSIGGWTLTKNSFYHTDVNNSALGLFSQGKNWTILSPVSTTNDINKKGNPQTGSGQPSAGDTHDYYIIAGNRFGVTIDGEIYSAGGRIGGWYINEKTLYSGNISIDSQGNIKCSANPLNPVTNYPPAAEGIIYIVAENKAKVEDAADPNFTYKIITTLQNQDATIRSLVTITVAKGSQRSDGNYTINCSGNKSKITISGTEYKLEFITGILYVTDAIWNIDNTGHAYFHDIQADGGYIAGWHIDNDKIWNDDGTTLSASNNATYEQNRYTIVTNSIAASGGNIGGWSLGADGLKGTKITLNPQGKLEVGQITIDSSTDSISFGNGGNIQSGGEQGFILINSLQVSQIDFGPGTFLFNNDDVSGLQGWIKQWDGSKKIYYTPQDVGL